MIVLFVIIFILLVYGLFTIFEIGFVDFIGDIIKSIKKLKGTSLKNKILEVHRKKINNNLINLIKESKEVMIKTEGMNYYNKMIGFSFLLFVGAFIICALINNFFVFPLLSVLLPLLPFIFIRYKYLLYEKQIKSELESALYNITSTYMKNNNTLLFSFKENIQYVKSPLKKLFEEFIFNSEFVNPSLKDNLLVLKQKINNQTFHEWVDNVISSLDDISIKNTLFGIVSKYQDMRIVNNEMTTKMYEPLREFIIMAVMVVSVVPLFYFLNKDWYILLTTSTIGKALLSITLMIIIIATYKVITILKPLEYSK